MARDEIAHVLGAEPALQRALAQIADLAARGYVNANGKKFSAASVASMLGAA